MINTLYQIIDDNQIKLIETDLKSIDPILKGLYFDNIILLDKHIETRAEKTCVLAEEVGHYFTTVGDILDKNVLHKEKEEEKAHRWATKEVIKIEDLILAFNKGVRNRWELSIFLDVTEEFIEQSLVFFEKEFGTHVVIGDYYINFNPLWIYRSFD